jgi:penicillin V acylase-like amidase (Ntn superfamily)
LEVVEAGLVGALFVEGLEAGFAWAARFVRAQCQQAAAPCSSHFQHHLCSSHHIADNTCCLNQHL